MSNPFPRPLILGHRGAPFDAAENTLRSFTVALRQGADGVEVDVRGASDGVPVVIHDETLQRTMSHSARVADHPWPALQTLSAAQLPSLQQVTAWAAAAQAWLNVEIKSPGVEAAAIADLRAAGMLPHSFISSFHPGVVVETRRLAPECPSFLLTSAWDEAAQEAIASTGANGVCLHVDAATPLALEVLHRQNLPVVVWTVDSPDRMRELLYAGVAAIITNRPAVATQLRVDVLGPH
jgi:glycerophosphoryl diester phosphodiesterase